MYESLRCLEKQGGSAPARIQVSKIENMVIQMRDQLNHMADRPEVIASKLDHHVQVSSFLAMKDKLHCLSVRGSSLSWGGGAGLPQFALSTQYIACCKVFNRRISIDVLARGPSNNKISI